MCVSGNDIWHLDCDRVQPGAAPGETWLCSVNGLPGYLLKYLPLLHIRVLLPRSTSSFARIHLILSCLVTHADSESSSDDSRSRTHSMTSPSPTGSGKNQTERGEGGSTTKTDQVHIYTQHRYAILFVQDSHVQRKQCRRTLQKLGKM